MKCYTDAVISECFYQLYSRDPHNCLSENECCKRHFCSKTKKNYARSIERGKGGKELFVVVFLRLVKHCKQGCLTKSNNT